MGNYMRVVSKAKLSREQVSGWIEEILIRRFRGFVVVLPNDGLSDWYLGLPNEKDGLPYNNRFWVDLHRRTINSKHAYGSDWIRWVQYTLFVELAKKLGSKIYDDGLERGYEPEDYGDYRSYYLMMTEHMGPGITRVFVREGYHHQAPKGWWR